MNNIRKKIIEVLTLSIIVLILLITILIGKNGLLEEKTEFARAILLGIGIVFIIIEIAFNFNNVKDDTTNIILYKWSKGKYFFIPFAFGAIGGHLFLGTKEPIFPKFDDLLYQAGLMPVLLLFSICAIMILIGHIVKFHRTNIFFSFLIFLGLLYGHFLWSMNIY